MRLLLDTTVLIDTLRGRPAARHIERLVGAGEHLLTCPVNVEEIWRGALPAEHDDIQRLLAGLRVVPLRRREGERAGRWRRDFATHGVTLHQPDCLVAAASLTADAALATGNPKHFPMPDVRVEHWRVGE